MAAMIVIDLLPLWHEREIEEGRDLSIREVAEAKGLSWETVAKYKRNQTQRFDSAVLGPLCEYFGVPADSTIPFLKVRYNGDGP